MEEFDAQELRDWAGDPRGKVFWDELGVMANKRMAGIRTAIQKGEHNQAAILNGELNCCEEVLQLVDIIIQDAIQEEDDKESA